MSDQLVFDGMPSRLHSATPARLGTFADCPRRYRFGYLDRPAPPRGAPFGHTGVGAAVHVALARWWDLPLPRRTPAAGGSLLSDVWPADGFRDEAQRAEMRALFTSYVVSYLARVDPADAPLAVEQTLSVRCGEAFLWGRVDRVDDRPEGLVVVDYKTGRRPPEVEDARGSTALAVYAAAAAETFRRPCTRVELHHLPSGTVAAFEHTRESLADALRQAERLAEQVAELDARHADLPRDEQGADAADELFPAVVEPRCGWCAFRGACGPGRSVPAHRPWDGLPVTG